MTDTIFTDKRTALSLHRALRVLAASLWAGAALAAGALQARAADLGDLAGDEYIFISPAGEVFAGPVTDPYPIVQWFTRIDKNGDGKVDIDEFRADALHVFDALDRDKDGVLDSGEIRIYEAYLVPIVTKVNPMGGDVAANQGAAPYSLFQEPEPVTAADRNFDFQITRKEFTEQTDRHFHTLDKGAKGYFTLTELPRTQMEEAFHATRVAKPGAASPAAAKPPAVAPKGN